MNDNQIRQEILSDYYMAMKNQTRIPDKNNNPKLKKISSKDYEFNYGYLVKNDLVKGAIHHSDDGTEHFTPTGGITRKGISFFEEIYGDDAWLIPQKLDLRDFGRIHNFKKWVKNHNKISIVFLLLAILALPSSLTGINEFTNIFEIPEHEEPYVCETGPREGWYKNCKYGFQFEIPTENWLIYDKNTGMFAEEPYYELDVPEYWIVVEHKVDYLGIEAASILFQIHDLTEHPWGSTLDEVLEYDKNKTSNDSSFVNSTYNRINDKYWYVDFVNDISDDYNFLCSSDVRLIEAKMHTRQICIGEWVFEREDWPLLFDDLDQFEDSFRYMVN